MKLFLLSLIAYVLAMATYASGGPTTQPESKAAYIKPNADLAPLIVAAKAGQVLECTPNSTYTVKSTCGPTAVGVTVHANGSKITLTASPGASSNFAVHAAHFTVSDAIFSGGLVCFRDYGDSLTVNNCQFVTCTTAVQTDIGGSNVSVLGCKVDQSHKVGVYLDQSGFVVDKCYLGPSDLEYACRVELSSNGKKLSGGKITNSTLYNPRNSQNGSKDCLGIRVGDNVYVGNCTITNDVRVGQVPKVAPWPNPTSYCNNIQFANCTINGIPTGINGIAVYQGSTCVVNSVTILAMDPLSVDANSILTADDCVHQVPWPGPQKSLIALSSKGAHSERNTTSVMMPPAK